MAKGGGTGVAGKSAGYSGTPLSKKLGIAEGGSVFPIGAPAHYRELLAPLPLRVRFTRLLEPSTDIVHLFVRKREVLAEQLRELYPTIRADAAIWVSWPKKSARVETDITEDTIRAVALPLGLVDVKVCAVDETWSGLKLVIRTANRSLPR
jgi:hypothetical protein